MLSDRKVWGWADLSWPGADASVILQCTFKVKKVSTNGTVMGMADVEMLVLNCWVTKNVEKKLTFAWQLLNENNLLWPIPYGHKSFNRRYCR